MKTLIYTHADCSLHQGQGGYFENPERLAAVERALNSIDAERTQAPLGAMTDILRVHPQTHIDTILQSVPDGHTIALTDDAGLDAYTAAAALRGVGAACDAVDRVYKGETEHAFVATRPPGHHTEPEQAMGFCYFSTLAIAAQRARTVHGVKKIAVVDFDVHHANGTQACLRSVPDMLFASIHQHPHYPNTGAKGIESAPCTIINVPLPGGTSADRWRRAFADHILTPVRDFGPELLFVSAGFDAHADDPLGDFNLTSQDYSDIARDLAKLSNGKMISILEGGYNLAALEESVRAYTSAVIAS